MPSRITISCPDCGAQLKLADESKLGKKIKCPKCSEVFVAASDEEPDDDDDFDDEEDNDEEEEEQPRGKKGAAATGGKKGAAAKKGKGKPAKSGGNLGLIIGAAGAVAIVLIGGLVGVLYAAGVFGGGKVDPNLMTVGAPGNGVFARLLKGGGPIPPRGPIPEEAKWLPVDSEFVLHIRVAEIVASPLVSDIVKSMQLEESMNGPLKEFGLKLADVESVSFGMTGLEQASSQMQQAQLAVMMGQPPAAQSMPGIAVVKLKEPITADAILKATPGFPISKVQHAGKEYLVGSPPNASTKSGIYLASDKLLVFAEEPTLKAAMEKGPATRPVPNFGFVDWTDQLSIGVAPKDPQSIKKNRPPGSSGNPMLDQMFDTFANGASGFSIGVSVKQGVDAEIAIGCVDQPKMDAIVKSLNDLIGVGKPQYEQSKKDLPPWAAALTDQLVANVKASGSNRVALITTNLPDSAQQQLAQLPAMLMTQFMMSTMFGKPPKEPSAGKSEGDKPASSPGDK